MSMSRVMTYIGALMFSLLALFDKSNGPQFINASLLFLILGELEKHGEMKEQGDD